MIIEMNMNSQINPFTKYRTERAPIPKEDYIIYASGKKVSNSHCWKFLSVWYSILMDDFFCLFFPLPFTCTRKKCLYLEANRKRAYLIFICLLRPTPVWCFYHITLISTILPWCASFLRSSPLMLFLFFSMPIWRLSS